jgi:hypothetical protein
MLVILIHFHASILVEFATLLPVITILTILKTIPFIQPYIDILHNKDKKEGTFYKNITLEEASQYPYSICISDTVIENIKTDSTPVYSYYRNAGILKVDTLNQQLIKVDERNNNVEVEAAEGITLGPVSGINKSFLIYYN